VSCPACQARLVPGQERCPACGTLVGPATDGALAPDPLALAEPPKAEPLREIPGRRKREKTWKDEVRDRVRQRKRRRHEGDLPLFANETDAASAESAAEEPISAAAEPEPEPDPAPSTPESTHGEPTIAEEPLDLPLRAEPAGADPPAPRPTGPARGDQGDDEEEPPDAPDTGWRLELAPEEQPARPIERPARLEERLLAAGLDLAFLVGLFAIVAYFAYRAAPSALPRRWPYLAGYLAALGLGYAAYFTGITGQTLGKLAVGLRVVDRSGQAPGVWRALARAALACLGIGLVGAGLVPALFDPARRALHDRLLRVRVIKL